MNALIEIEKVGYRYGRESVFEDVSIALPEGEFLVILGPNGSGKTTLLRLIAGLAEPAQGMIRIGGEPVSAWQQRGEIGFVPQQYNRNAAAFPATVAEVVAMGLQGRHWPREKRQAAIEDALARVKMSSYANRRIGDLSGGQQQRVLVAQAIAKRPQVLLLDEPTSGVDYLAGAELMGMLRDLNRDEGTTIVMVSHDVERAVSYGTKVACMNRGLCYYGDEAGFRERHGRGVHFSYTEGK